MVSIETSLTNTLLKLLKNVRAETQTMWAAMFTLLLSTLGMFGSFGEVTSKLGWDQLCVLGFIALIYVIGFNIRPRALANIELRYFSIIQQINFILVYGLDHLLFGVELYYTS